MRNQKTTKYSPSKLFSHREDEAFKLLERLEGLFAKMVFTAGSRYLRERLQRASARLAEIVIIESDAHHPDAANTRYQRAVLITKVVDGMLRLLARYAMLAFSDYDEAATLATQLIRVIARRYFGFDAADPDDGSPSGSTPAEVASIGVGAGPARDVAAARPPGPSAKA